MSAYHALDIDPVVVTISPPIAHNCQIEIHACNCGPHVQPGDSSPIWLKSACYLTKVRQ
jgi:hypothetical protein